MAYVMAGKIIKMLRKQRGMSQEELAELVHMERTNISRIERGNQQASKMVIDDILYHLGALDSRFFNFALSNNEYEVYELREKLNEALIKFDWNTAGRIIEEMEKMPAFENGFHKQFLLERKAAYLLDKGEYKGECLESGGELLDQAIKMSIKDFDYEKVESYVLGHEEVEIITKMAEINSAKGNYELAYSICEALIKNIKRDYVSEKEKAILLTQIFYNYSKHLGLNGEHKKASAICDEAIRLSRIHSVYSLLPFILCNKACSCFYLNQYEEAKSLFYQSYFSFVGFGQTEMALTLKAEIKENYNIEILPL